MSPVLPYSGKSSILHIAEDPFSPGANTSGGGGGDPNDLMAAFGAGAGASPGAAAANPWDLGALDPMPLMSQVRLMTDLSTITACWL